MEDQKREWQLRDKKQRQQNQARANLMKEVYSIRDNQLAEKGANRRADIEADKEERNRILAVSTPDGTLESFCVFGTLFTLGGFYCRIR